MKVRKKALVLGGGGSRGSYEVGVWQALNEHGYRPDIVTGTSVGALNGAMVVQGKLEETIALWRTLTTDMVMDVDVKPDLKTMTDQLTAMSVFAREAIKNRGADTTPLRRLLAQYIEEDVVRAAGIPFGLVTVALPHLKPRALFLDEMEKGTLLDYLLASSAFFPAMQGQTIHGAVHIDGGYYDNLPIELAVSRGAREILAIDLHAPGVHRRVRDPDVEIHRIEPEWDLGNVLIFDPKTAERNIAIGYLDGLKYLGVYDGVLYAFQNRDFWDRISVIVADLLTLIGELTPRVILPGGWDVSELSVARLRTYFLRHVSGYYRYKRLPRRQLGIVIVEMAGRLFQMDPTHVYTIRDFEATLRTAVRRYVADTALEELDAVLRSSMPLREKTERALELSRNQDARGICLWLTREIRRCTSGTSQVPLWLLAAGRIFPTEFLTAIYLTVLEPSAD